VAYLIAQPQVMAAAAADVAALHTAINGATAAAASGTTNVAAMAGDEVSEAIKTLFNGFAEEGQAVIAQAAVFHSEFAQALASAGSAYANAEAANFSALTAPLRSAAASLLVDNSAFNVTGNGGGPAIGAALANSYVTFVTDGSGTSIPSADFVTNVVGKYLGSTLPAGVVKALPLPAGEYPDSGIKDLTSDVSIARGVTILNNAIQQQLAAGNGVNVVAYSQSANIASLVMQQLDPAGTPSSLPVNFVLLGNSMNPNGGWDARFAGLSLPSLGITTLGPAPSNSFPTQSYTIEYDGWADFPRYPINIVSDLNALAGMVTVHETYDILTPAQINSAIVLPTQGPTTTTYYMIPSQNLPLLEPLRSIPYLGNPLADFVQPVLRPIVNWGYGDPNFGWSTGPADVFTPIGFLPPLSDTLALGPAVLNGFPQGIAAASNTLYAQGLPQLPSLSGLSDALLSSSSAPLALPTGPTTITDVIHGLQAANTQIVGGSTAALSTAYATLLPTTDIATAALVSLPSYDFNLFLNGIEQMAGGQPLEGLINAFGTPVAANMGLLPFLAGLEVVTLGEAVDTIVTGTPYPSP
jgi:PE-PPE domain-containing protein/PE family protein